MFTPTLRLFAVAAALVSMVGCSSSDSSGSVTPGDDQDIKSIKTCGGIAGVQCAAGEDCVIAKKDLSTPDASGKCRKPTGRGGEGQICGGIAGIPCGSGLECALPTDNGHPIPDIAGHCVKPSGSTGQACGGIAGLRCPQGLTCVSTTGPNGTPIPDAGGHCEK